MVEIEFHISRSHGLVGLVFENVDGKFTLKKINEPCLANYLGLVEVDDILVAVDGKEVTCEADLVPPIDEVGASYSKDDMCLKLERRKKATQHDIEGDVIKKARSLIKSTPNTDHKTQANLRLSIGEVLLSRGDFVQAQDVLEDGLNIAYGINIGVNRQVVIAYSSLSQVYYCQGNYSGADEALKEAEAVLRKLDTNRDNLVLQLELINKKAEVAICLENEEEMLNLKSRAAEILKIILSLQVRVLCES